MIQSPGPSDRRVQTVCLLTLTLISIGVTLWLLQPVLVPFVLAIFFSQCLAPVIHLLMKRYKLPEVVAVSLAALLGAGVVVGAAFLISASISTMKGTWDQTYQIRWDEMVQWIARTRAGAWLHMGADGKSATLPPDLQSGLTNLSYFLAQFSFNLVKNVTSVLLFMAFLLFGRRWSSRPNRGLLVKEIEVRVQKYIILTVGISVLTGLLVGVSMSLIGVQFALAFGFLAFLLNFIPNLGAVIATLLPLPIVFLDPHLGLVAKFLALAIPAAIQIAIGSLVQPKMMGQSLDLHPVVLLLSLLFFTLIWGVGGAFLATPVTAVIKIVFEKIPLTRPLAAALAGDLEPIMQALEAGQLRAPGRR